MIWESCFLKIKKNHNNNKNLFYGYNITQQVECDGWLLINKLALVATSKISSTPSPVKAEHSRYLRAPISLAIASASWGSTK